MTRQPPKDRRVQKTERLLRDAIGSLIHEKSYGAIAVREILERANVGRSAFYAHFSNKDALFATAIEQMLHETPPRLRSPAGNRLGHVVWFSYRIFEHIDRFRHAASVMKGRKSRALVHHHLRRVLLEQVLAAIEDGVPRSQHPARVPASLLADYVVSTFILVVNWWVDSRSTLSPREVDDLFRSLVFPALAALGDRNSSAS